jgi:1-acyl-sn-glycerol-3-phosphate acyltransferase
MLLWILNLINRLALRVFFRKVEVRGVEGVPSGRPLMFVANHPSVMLDILLLGRYIPGETPRFIGKSTLFTRPLHAWFMGMLGVVSVSRAMDPGARLSGNKEMLRVAGRILQEGHSLAIFPEGSSHAESRVRDLKSGTARIALRTELETDGRAGIAIVPVGLTYSDPGAFRSEAAVHFGSPIEVGDYLDSYRNNRKAAGRELTDRMHRSIASLTRHIENPELEAAVRDFHAIYAGRLAAGLPDSGEVSRSLRAEQEIIRAVDYFSRTDPELLQRFTSRLRLHCRKVRRFHLGGRELQHVRSPLSPAGLLCGIVLSPAALYGFIHNALPFYLTRFFARSYENDLPLIGTVKLATGTVVFPAWYCALTFLAYFLTNLRTSLLYGLTLPAGGIFFLFYEESFLQRWRPWRTAGRRSLGRLADERDLIVRDLDTLKVRYLSEQAGVR